MVLVLLAVTLSARLAAHPSATSFVVVGVTKSEIEVALTTDERALKLRLAGLGAETVESQIDLRVDGAPVPLTLRTTERVNDRAGQVRLIFVALMPPGGSRLQWKSSLFFGAYPLAVQPGSAASPPPADRDYEWVAGPEPSRVYDLDALHPASLGWPAFRRLVATGFTHILPGGLDHVLFVLGLTLLAVNFRSLALQISLFTVAHSATLGLAMAGVVAVPARVVEPLIAVSIAYVALENLRATSLSYWRLLLVLGFGLLHGLGFAGALRDTGLAGGSLVTTLLGFNLGVELGQLTVVLSALALLRLVPLRGSRQAELILRPASVAIAAVGVFWAVQRTIG